MEISEVIQVFAIIAGIASSMLALLTAIVSRRKIIEVREGSSQNMSWYDNSLWIIFWWVVFWPIAVYGVIKRLGFL